MSRCQAVTRQSEVKAQGREEQQRRWAEGYGVSDERWRDTAIVAANRVVIFAAIFTSTQSQRARLREALSLVFGAPAEG